jgi:hypothetical protein
MSDFLDYVKKTDKDIVYANIINNGVCAYFQQHQNLLPKSIAVFNEKGVNRNLLDNGKTAEDIHNYFIDNIYQFIKGSAPQPGHIEITNRFSINFFAIKGENWHKITDIGKSDELKIGLRSELTKILYLDFYVSHLSFYTQLNMSLEALRERYMKIYNSLSQSFLTNVII